MTTPTEWYKRYIGKSVDCDNFPKYNIYQCWDYLKKFQEDEGLKYFNCHCSLSGYAGDIWKLRYKNGAETYFTFITDVNDLRDGDWCFWNQHVAFYYNGKEVGQNQYGRAYVTSIPFQPQGFLGAFRYKFWTNEKGVAEKWDKRYNQYYATTAPLNLRTGGNTSYPIIVTIPVNQILRCYGYYHEEKDVPWFYVSVTINGRNYIGFVCSKYLEEV